MADDIVLVNYDQIRSAKNMILDDPGLVVEPAGVAGSGAVLANLERWKGLHIAVPLCSGSV